VLFILEQSHDGFRLYNNDLAVFLGNVNRRLKHI
jgi:hypothetical protein